MYCSVFFLLQVTEMQLRWNKKENLLAHITRMFRGYWPQAQLDPGPQMMTWELPFLPHETVSLSLFILFPSGLTSLPFSSGFPLFAGKDDHQDFQVYIPPI